MEATNVTTQQSLNAEQLTAIQGIQTSTQQGQSLQQVQLVQAAAGQAQVNRPKYLTGLYMLLSY